MNFSDCRRTAPTSEISVFWHTSTTVRTVVRYHYAKDVVLLKRLIADGVVDDLHTEKFKTVQASMDTQTSQNDRERAQIDSAANRCQFQTSLAT